MNRNECSTHSPYPSIISAMNHRDRISELIDVRDSMPTCEPDLQRASDRLDDRIFALVTDAYFTGADTPEYVESTDS